MFEPDFDKDRQEATKWAQGVLARSDWVVLDTETTGLGGDDQIVQIAIIDCQGTPLLNTLVKPTISIPIEASRIHGITDEMVQDAPSWADVRELVRAAIKDKIVLIYNAGYDTRLMEQCDRAAVQGTMLPDLPELEIKCVCVMEEYARWYGQWNSWHGNYRWQRLPSGDHSALGDCIATLGVIRKMASQ